MQEAVARLVNRQSGSGSFGLWSAYGDDGSLWLSAYVTDFLLRAREKGFEVPEDVLVSGLDYIRNMVGNAPDIEAGPGQDMAYALYVLARAGRAPGGRPQVPRRIRKLNDFGSPLARAQIASALCHAGRHGARRRGLRLGHRGAMDGRGDHHQPRPTAPTMAACCAMPPPSWRWPPMPRPSPKSSARP